MVPQRRRDRLEEWGRGALVLLALVPLLPSLRGNEPPSWALGEVAPRSVIAEFAFPVLRDRSEFESELRRLRGEIPALLTVSDTARVGSRDRLSALRERVEILRSTRDPSGPDSLELGLDPETRMSLVLGDQGPRILGLLEDLANEVERRGYVSAQLNRDLEPYQTVTILGGGDPVHVTRERLLTPASLRDSAAVVARQRRVPEGSVLALVGALFSPNLEWQKAETEELVERAESGVPRHRRFVRRGEKIVGANEVISQDVALALESYSFWWGAEGRPDRESNGFVDRAARLLLGAMAVFLAFAALGAGRRLPPRPRGLVGDRTAFAILVAVGLLVSCLMLRVGGLDPLLLPAAGVALTASLLLGSSSGLLAGLLFSTLVALPGGAGFSAWAVLMVGASFAVLSRPHDPVRLGRSALFAGLLQGGTALALLGLGSAAEQVAGRELLSAFLGPFLGLALAWAAVTTVERRARWATPLGMGDLTALDHPLLARLQAEAPGTYAHSVRVASLADAAARAIGMDGRLARAIGYYHDVGKLARSGDFPENGGGPVTEERRRLLREMHVREGVALAEEARLPREVVRGIAEHHGTELGPEGDRPTFPESAAVLVANRVARVPTMGAEGGREALAAALRRDALCDDLEGSGITLGDLDRMRQEMLALWSTWDRAGRDGA